MTAPFLDFDLFDFLQSIPVEIRLGHQLHTRTIGRAYPEYSHVRFHTDPVPNFVRRWRRRLNNRVYLPMLRTGRCAKLSWKLKRLQTLWFDDVA